MLYVIAGLLIILVLANPAARELLGKLLSGAASLAAILIILGFLAYAFYK